MTQEDTNPNLDWKPRLKKTFRLKNIEKIRDYVIKEIYQNELMNLEEKVCLTLKLTEHFLNLLFWVTGCISITVFGSLVDIPTGCLCSTIGLNIYAIFVGIKKYKLIIKKGKTSMIKQYFQQKLS